MSVRNLLMEATQWRGNLRPSSPLTEPLASVQGSTLVDAYQLWWEVYSAGIRRAPSVSRPEGVAATDVAPVAREANDAVLALLAQRA